LRSAPEICTFSLQASDAKSGRSVCCTFPPFFFHKIGKKVSCAIFFFCSCNGNSMLCRLGLLFLVISAKYETK
jgi:hypothetical protein